MPPRLEQWAYFVQLELFRVISNVLFVVVWLLEARPSTPSRGEAREPDGNKVIRREPGKDREGNLEGNLVSKPWWSERTIR